MEATSVIFDDVSVSYGATKAIDHLSLTLRPGEIVGLLGHNGAGKSTLVNVATGAVGASSGSVYVGGELVTGRPSPSAMAARGVAVIHQEPALAPELSITDNLFLARKTSVPAGRRKAVARAAIAALGLDIDPSLPVSALPLGQRQVVDLARASLQGDVKVLFLDEPTAGLGKEETDRLHRLIREFAARGTAVAYVSHRLPDVLDVCDRIVVLRSGKLVLDRASAGFTVPELGRALAPDMQSLSHSAQAPGARVISLPDFGVHVDEGEIVGLFGMAGGRQFEILESIFGAGSVQRMELDGTAFAPRSPATALRRSIHMVQADRERESLAAGMSALDNVTLPWVRGLSTPFGIDGKKADALYAQARETYNILGPDKTAPISAFSGGNRQKHVVARWTVPQRPKLLLLAQPTQGVDVGAKVDIIRALRALAASGTAVLVASAEGDEIASICDRAYVIDRGSATPVARSTSFEDDLVSELLTLSTHERKVI